MDEIEGWKSDICALLAIPEQERTEDEQIRVWARRVRLLYRGWRVVLGMNGEPGFRYVGNADRWPESWDEIRKDEMYEQ
jgi:hypothetical protein